MLRTLSQTNRWMPVKNWNTQRAVGFSVFLLGVLLSLSSLRSRTLRVIFAAWVDFYCRLQRLRLGAKYEASTTRNLCEGLQKWRKETEWKRLNPFTEAIPPKPSGKRGKLAKSDAHNLWERFQAQEASVLLFAKNPQVSFTNNRAEQDLRMSKVKQKVSGCFRTEIYALAYCRISSYLQTMANRGYNPLIAVQWHWRANLSLQGASSYYPNSK